ncbi:MAG: efflux RND transporter periplasmic adaptor subunit, partial [Chitinivibrionales bacterium]
TQGDHLERIYSPELISLQKEIQEAKKSGKEDTERNSLVTRSRERSLKAAKEKLRLLGFKKWKIDNIVSREKSSEYMTIRAHQKGVVIKKMIEEGSYVKTGDPLFHIADLSRVWIKLEAYEADLTWLRLGQKVVFSVSAFPGEEFTGTVSFIDPVVDPSTRTVKVRVIADNKDMRLKPEMFVKAVVKPEVSKTGKVINKEMKGKWISPMHPQVVKDGPGTCDICGMPLVKAEELGYVTSGFEEIEPILIPATAPLITGKRAVVYVELQNTGNPTYEGREIKLGPRVGNYYIVRSGLSAGEEVVVNGAFKIDGELQIRAKPSMMNTQEPDSEKNLLPQGLDPEDHAEEEFKPADPEVLPEGFKKELNRLYSSYFKTAEGLKQDNLENTVSGLEAVHSSLVKIREGSKDTHSDWETIEQGLQRELIDIDKIASLSDARTLFYSISKVLIAAEKRYNKVLSSKHFLAFCPMAFNNQGAYWLQEDREIKNPYFGESMLGCGEIKEEYKNTGNFTD